MIGEARRLGGGRWECIRGTPTFLRREVGEGQLPLLPPLADSRFRLLGFLLIDTAVTAKIDVLRRKRESCPRFLDQRHPLQQNVFADSCELRSIPRDHVAENFERGPALVKRGQTNARAGSFDLGMLVQYPARLAQHKA